MTSVARSTRGAEVNGLGLLSQGILARFPRLQITLPGRLEIHLLHHPTNAFVKVVGIDEFQLGDLVQTSQRFAVQDDVPCNEVVLQLLQGSRYPRISCAVMWRLSAIGWTLPSST